MLDQVMPDPKRRRGLMLVMSSPSGAGKTSISRRVLELEPELTLSISVTTRPQRPGETDGVHYHFIVSARFDAHGRGRRAARARRASTATTMARRALLSSRRWPAAATCCSTSTGRAPSSCAPRPTDDMVGVFILPPSLAELERRLRGRAQDPEETVRFRLAQVSSDVTHWPEYDYVLVNKDFEASVAAVRAILAAERMRRKRQPGLTEFVEQFRSAAATAVPVRAPPRCHGQRPSISTSSEKLRKVRISTMPASTARLCSVGSTATVPMMSAATRNSSPSRMPRPRLARYSRKAASSASFPQRAPDEVERRRSGSPGR